MQLRVDQLECTVGSHRLIRDLSLSLVEHECLVLTGANGSGKTTLLRAVAGLLRPSGGTISWREGAQGSEAQGSNNVWQAIERARWTQLMLYHGHALGWKAELTVSENLRLQVQLDGLLASAAQLDGALGAVGLTQRRDLAFAQLSAGQRRRLTLARISLDQRPLWLLDEPTTALDDAGQKLLAELIDQHRRRGGMAIIATHQNLALGEAVRELNLSLPRASLSSGRTAPVHPAGPP